MAENQEPLIECPDCGCRFDSPAVARLLAEQAEQAEAERDRLRGERDALAVSRNLNAENLQLEARAHSEVAREADALRHRVTELEGERAELLSLAREAAEWEAENRVEQRGPWRKLKAKLCAGQGGGDDA